MKAQCTRTANLSGFLKLTADSGHHSEASNEAEATQDVRDTCSLHSKSLEMPIASCNRSVHALCNVACMTEHHIGRVRKIGNVLLSQQFVHVHLDVVIVLLEQIFEEQSKELPSQFKPLVSHIVSVIDHR